MEDIRKVKTIISRINRKCDKESISLSDALNKLGITPINYLEIIGLNNNIVNDNILKEIERLFSLSDTRIIINPSMESLEHDEVEIYSKETPIVVHFLKNKISLDNYEVFEDEENIYEKRMTNICKDKEEISYELNITINKDDKKTRLISEKYPLKHMWIKVTYKSKNINRIYEFTINHDMLKSDLNYIIRLLSNFNYIETFAILNRYPTSMKIIGENNQTCIKQ